MGRSVSDAGLIGAWAWREVKAIHRIDIDEFYSAWQIGGPGEGPSSAVSKEFTQVHTAALAQLTGNRSSFISFSTIDSDQTIRTTATYLDREGFPWSGKKLFLLGSAKPSSRRQLENYTLAIVNSSSGGWYDMHRVASICGEAVELAYGPQSIQGILN